MSIIPPRPDSCLIRLPRPPGERGVPVMDCSLPYEQLRERPGGVVGVPGSDTDGVPREADEEKSPARSEGQHLLSEPALESNVFWKLITFPGK